MPLIVGEAMSPAISGLLVADRQVVVSTLTFIEASSALARRYRTARDDEALEEGRSLLRDLSGIWTEIELNADITSVASELVFRHPLKAADAVQLATAITVARTRVTLPFVTLDQTLAAAARAEGFTVQP